MEMRNYRERPGGRRAAGSMKRWGAARFPGRHGGEEASHGPYLRPRFRALAAGFDALRTGAFFAAGLRAAGFLVPAFAAGFFAAGLALADPALRARRRAIAVPSSAGERTVVTLAASSAANLSAAVPLPPEITAPA